MKKLFASLACAALLITALTGCGQKTGSTRTPEELTQLYSQAITESGGEMVEYNPVITQIDDENEINGMILESMGLKAEDMTAFGVSGSMMSVKAYGIAAVMPAEGKEEAVKEGLQGFIDKQKTNFETYLADQYAVAENARLETLEDGTVLKPNDRYLLNERRFRLYYTSQSADDSQTIDLYFEDNWGNMRQLTYGFNVNDAENNVPGNE